MKNNNTTWQIDKINTEDLNEKRKWIEPQISKWESDKLEAGDGGVVDGGSQTYA
ncbi:hypothetical protein [Aquirufa ecclesiirivi]|uniref:hypothetical protein n=1 Tax=Aquirufa ecclesiirivi TaxID=2715124 RepID=UPI0023D83666|nr:hypothetical protein [Aquirufa ecclesiirivi]MDF0694712.1 hypothetical protein [Aquirufa ecclesiirivi]